MRFDDGQDIAPGDYIRVAGTYRGRVVASMDTGEYLPGQEEWAYLREGMMVDTDFGGLVHYTAPAADRLELIERACSSRG